MTIKDYTLESRKRSSNGFKKKRIIRGVTSMTRANGVMCFKTERNGIIRRRDSAWDLVQLRIPKSRSRWN